jgi:hypothetical protein
VKLKNAIGYDRGNDLHRFEIVSGRLAGLAVHHDFEGNALALTQFAQAGALDGADMNEHVFATAFGLNESITLLRVEPLYGAVIRESLLIDISDHRHADVSRANSLGSVRSRFW